MVIAMFVNVGCGKGNPLPSPAEVKSAPQIDYSEISANWKTNRAIEDFRVLKDALLKPGVDSDVVVDILGDPYSRSALHDGESYWLYVKVDVDKKQYYAWSCVVSEDGKVIKWYQKGME